MFCKNCGLEIQECFCGMPGKHYIHVDGISMCLSSLQIIMLAEPNTTLEDALTHDSE